MVWETEHIEGRKSACALKLRFHTGHVSSFWIAGFHESNGYLDWWSSPAFFGFSSFSLDVYCIDSSPRVVVLVGPCPVRFLLCFSAGWRSAYLAGGSAFRPLRFVVVLVCLCCDLPTYMTTGVHVDLILTCFFSCKDRASERYRPHRRKKKRFESPWASLCPSCHYVLRPRPGLEQRWASERLECQQTCFIMAPKTGPKKVFKTWLR